MSLPDDTLDVGGDRCVECGAKLTSEELQATLEGGGPALCKIHAAELAELDAEEPIADPGL